MKKLHCFIQSIFLIFLSLFIKRDPKKIAIGSWSGKLLIDNSKYLADYIKKSHPDFVVFWVGFDNVRLEAEKHGFVFLKKDKLSSNIKLLKCKYFFFSQMAESDISSFNVYRKATTCYLHHGMPIKKWGEDAIGYKNMKQNPFSRLYHKVTGASMHYDFFATSSRLHDISNCTSLRFRGCTDEKNLKCGTPRNDYIINRTNVDYKRCFDKYDKVFNLSKYDSVFLYLPTYRRKAKDIFSFANINDDESKKLSLLVGERRILIIEKSHFAEKNLVRLNRVSENVTIADLDINVQELFLVSDALISDYSGAFLDYLFMNKPIIHFAYDYEYYRDFDSGLYYDINDFSAGPIVKTFEELLVEIQNAAAGVDRYVEKREYVKNKYMSYETGNASKIIFEKVVLENEQE